MYPVYDHAKLQVFISRNVRLRYPMVGEDKAEPNEDSDSNNNYSSHSDTTEVELEEEEEEDKEEEEVVGDNNIPNSEPNTDCDEEELKNLLQQVGEAIPESLLGDDSQFAIDEATEIPSWTN